MSDDASRNDPLSELVEECLLRMEEEGSSVVQEICDRNPEQAEGLRRRLQALGNAGLLPDDSQIDGVPEDFGEYRIDERLGTGGMGVVYLATQLSLGRQVALKIIRPEQLYFPKARQRFRREVEAVARLEHPGIVRIFNVGEEQGIPFFAMERVAGASLGELLEPDFETGALPREGQELRRRLSQKVPVGSSSSSDTGVFEGSWARSACRIALQVAEALQHAHERGVLHRDLKPSNVMLTPAGRAVLLDFGLATIDDAQPLTRSGAMLGSLPYMAPEQIEGDGERIDARTDVYGLGALLYELLTLAPAFRGKSGEQMRQKIVKGDYLAPSQQNPDVPSDAETICLMAMELDPAKRYQDMAAFAQDLRNFLELRPIAARRQSALRRAQQIARRHPAQTAVIGTFLIAGLIASLIFAWQQRLAAEEVRGLLESEKKSRAAAEKATERERQARGVAEAAMKRSRHNFDRTVELVDAFLRRVAAKGLSKTPGIESLRRELIADSLALIRELEPEAGDDADHLFAIAKLELWIGRLHHRLEEFDAAKENTLRAHTRLKALLDQEPDRDDYRLELANCMSFLCFMAIGAGDYAAAEELVLDSIRLLESRARAPEGAGRIRLALVRHIDNFANLRNEHGEFDLATSLVERAEKLLEQATKELTGPADIERARLHATRARIAQQQRKLAPALKHHRASIELLTSMGDQVDELNEDNQLRRLTTLSESYFNLSELESVRRRWNEALDLARLSLEQRQKIVTLVPGRVEHRYHVASAKLQVATVLLKKGERKEGLEALGEAGGEYAKLLDTHPGYSAHSRQAGIAFSMLAMELQSELAEKWNERAEYFLRLRLKESPRDLQARNNLAVHLVRWAPKSKSNDTRREYLEEALQLFVDTYEASGKLPVYRSYAGRAAIELAEAFVLCGRLDEAVASARRAVREFGLPATYLRFDGLEPLRGREDFEAIFK